MTWTAVGSAIFQTLSSFTLTPGGTGHLICLNVAQFSNGTVTATALSSSNVTWSFVGSRQGVNHTYTSSLFVGKVTSNSAATVTVTWSGTAPSSINIDGQEFSSSTGNWVVDSWTYLDAAGTATWTSLTPTATSLYYGGGIDAGSASPGSTAGYVYTKDSNGCGQAYNLSCAGGVATAPVWLDTGWGVCTMALIREVAAGTLTFRSVSSDGANVTTTASSRAPGRPAGSVAGDLLLISIAWSGSTITLTAPTGWSLFHNTQQTNANLATYWRNSDGTATDTPTLTLSAVCTCVATCTAISGWNGSAPVAANVLGGSASTTITYPAITPASAGDMLIYITGLRPSTASTQVTAVSPAGGTGGALTKATDICTNVSGSAEEEQAVIWQQLSAATAISQQTATVATTVSSNAEAICITPAPLAGTLIPQQERIRIPVMGPTRRKALATYGR